MVDKWKSQGIKMKSMFFFFIYFIENWDKFIGISHEPLVYRDKGKIDWYSIRFFFSFLHVRAVKESLFYFLSGCL